MSNYIEISGVTPATSFPKYSSNMPSNQICETDILCIPEQKPSIESILQVKVNVLVCSHEIICTCVGEKLVIEGVKHINIMYVADEPCQSVHSAHFDIPFCTFILLKEKNCEVVDIFAAIEDIKIKQLDSRRFSLSLIIFICPEFKKKNNPCKTDPYPCTNYYREDCENNYYKHKSKDHDNWKNKYDNDVSCPSHCNEEIIKDTCVSHEYNYKEMDKPNYCCGDYQVCKYCCKRDKCSNYK